MKWLLTLAVLWIGWSAQAQKWRQMAEFASTGRHRAVGLAIRNKGYAGMGHVNGTGTNYVYSEWWQYDPASNAWTQKADYANGTGTYGAIAFSTDQYGYVGGGTAFSTQYYKYDPTVNTWTLIAACPLDVDNLSAFGIGSKGYVMQGNQLAEYDEMTNSWAMKANCPVAMTTWNSTFVVGNSAFVKNGTQFYEYKPSQNTWIVRTSFPGLATGGSSAFSVNGKGYIVTGYSGGLSNVTDEIWEFNPGNNTWKAMEPFEGSARRFSVGFTVENKGYFGLGTNGINFNDWWQFDGTPNLTGLAPAPPSGGTVLRTKSESNVLTLNLENYGGNYDILSSSGVVLLSGQTAETLDLSSLPAGNYSIRLAVDETIRTLKLEKR